MQRRRKHPVAQDVGGPNSRAQGSPGGGVGHCRWKMALSKTLPLDQHDGFRLFVQLWLRVPGAVVASFEAMDEPVRIICAVL